MKSDTEILPSQGRFQTTRWHLVRRADDMAALDLLIRIYWKPLYVYLRQRGLERNEAQDSLQDFLAGLTERGSILRATPSRGRFRTFLLASLNNFLKDRGKAALRKKRGGGRPILSLDLCRGEYDYVRHAMAGETPELAFDRAWARSLLDQCVPS
jgi:DNA-directed RNA polymerase specialized sigma24 family protein